jgi:hypothetical protein
MLVISMLLLLNNKWNSNGSFLESLIKPSLNIGLNTHELLYNPLTQCV